MPSNFLEEATGEGEKEKGEAKTETLGQSGVRMEIFTASKEDLEEARRVIEEVNSKGHFFFKWYTGRWYRG